MKTAQSFGKILPFALNQLNRNDANGHFVRNGQSRRSIFPIRQTRSISPEKTKSEILIPIKSPEENSEILIPIKNLEKNSEILIPIKNPEGNSEILIPIKNPEGN